LHPVPVPRPDEVLAERYNQLRAWAVGLTRGDVHTALDIVHDLYLYVALAKPDFSRVENLDNYLYKCIRHIHLAHLSESSRNAWQQISTVELDSLGFASWTNSAFYALERQNELRRICHYVVSRKTDNDYALGRIVDAVSSSPFANDTIIVSIEDDAWDGADHVDSHRTVALFVGPYVKRRAVVSTRYTTVNVVKTIEELLGIGPIGLNDALAAPMSDVFDPNVETWFYKAIVPDVLRSTKLPLSPDDHATIAYPKHAEIYWTKAM
jgi:hypothetical protein